LEATVVKVNEKGYQSANYWGHCPSTCLPEVYIYVRDGSRLIDDVALPRACRRVEDHVMRSYFNVCRYSGTESNLEDRRSHVEVCN